MAKNKLEADTTVAAAHEPEPADDNNDHGGPPVATGAASGERSSGGSLFEIYKPGQGKYVRWGTAIGAGLIAVAGAAFLREQMVRLPWGLGESTWFRGLFPVALLVAAAYFIFWLVARNRKSVDFMIATEGEMKKVNWSTKKEVWGSTRVVIVTLLALGFLLFFVDLFFISFFKAIRVLRIDVNVFKMFFGGGGDS